MNKLFISSIIVLAAIFSSFGGSATNVTISGVFVDNGIGFTAGQKMVFLTSDGNRFWTAVENTEQSKTMRAFIMMAYTNQTFQRITYSDNVADKLAISWSPTTNVWKLGEVMTIGVF